ncbi:MAG: TRAP transporter substrate-binding protein DctP [Chloroflexaceae bacterium]|jgi:TRAP-type mannitol/chloroaromatic compound transport system substrate-binding protein|nr:TRAP transporter substrate-binding protein DctP [Chloroflexaceae bacterium]
MQRRDFLRGAAAGLLGGVGLTLGACAAATPPVAAPTAPGTAGATSAPGAQPPAQAQEKPAIEWQMATSWPESLRETIFGGAVVFSERLAALTGGKFKVTPEVAGKLAPGLQVLDVVSQGAVPMGHTASYYYVGKSPVTAFGTALPFGLNYQQQNAWLFAGGGLQQLQEFYAAKFNVIQFPAGNTGVQMGGWFRKEVNTVNDLQGLKMRIPGLGGQVMTKLGVTVQAIAGGEIFQALQTGAVDAAEWVGPYDDEKLGFNKVANFYYAPGWWEPGPTLEVEVNLDKWKELPAEYQEAVKTAAFEANTMMMAKYDALNQAALKTIVGGGVQLRTYSPEIMDAAETASFQLFDEFAAKDADFKKIFDGWKEFRTGVYSWNKVNEFSFVSHQYAKLT